MMTRFLVKVLIESLSGKSSKQLCINGIAWGIARGIAQRSVALVLILSLFGQSALAARESIGSDIKINIVSPIEQADYSNLESPIAQSITESTPQTPTNSPVSNRNSKRRSFLKKALFVGVGAAIVITGVVTGVVELLKDSNKEDSAPEIPSNPLPPSVTPAPSLEQVFQRGMYLSIWTDAIPANRTANYGLILDDSSKTERLLQFIEKESVDSLTLYNIPIILDTVGMAEKLAKFITAAKLKGVKEVYGAGARAYDFEAMSIYQKRNPNHFDGIITEVEFWNDPVEEREKGFKNFLALLNSMRDLNFKAWGKPVKIATYLTLTDSVPNHSEQDIANQIAPLTDRFIVSCYGLDPADSYSHCSSQLKQILQSGENFEIFPLLSAEGTDYRVDPKFVYMGDYVKGHPNLDEIEKSFMDSLKTEQDPARIHGIYYFEYSFLDLALNPPH